MVNKESSIYKLDLTKESFILLFLTINNRLFYVNLSELALITTEVNYSSYEWIRNFGLYFQTGSYLSKYYENIGVITKIIRLKEEQTFIVDRMGIV